MGKFIISGRERPTAMDRKRTFSAARGGPGGHEQGRPAGPSRLHHLTECCKQFLDSGGKWPDGLGGRRWRHMQRLGRTGRKFGLAPNPLLVSVRSGAAVSMPGMMEPSSTAA